MEFLAVAVWQEETARFVEQQVVEVALELLLLQTEFVLNGFDRVTKELRPFGIREREPIGIELPHAPDARIHEGRLALSVRSLFTVGLQFLRLMRRAGQTDRPETGDLQTGVRSAIAPGHTERTGAIDLLDRRVKLF